MDMVAVEQYLTDLQERICSALQALDGTPFRTEKWHRREGGGGDTRVLEGGGLLQKAGVNFSLVSGENLPPAATARRPQLAGCPYRRIASYSRRSSISSAFRPISASSIATTCRRRKTCTCI